MIKYGAPPSEVSTTAQGPAGTAKPPVTPEPPPAAAEKDPREQLPSKS